MGKILKINVDDLIGKAWEKNGRGPETYDCYGLVEEVERRFGHTWIRLEDCEKDGYVFCDCFSQWQKTVRIKEIPSPLFPADIVLMRTRGATANHCGVYMGQGQVIHCDRRGVHIDKLARLRGILDKCYTWVE